MEEERISATRHIIHLQALRKYQVDNHKSALTPADVEKLFEEGVVMENPDVDMADDNPTITGSNASTITGPNNASLTSQSLSFNGFSDSDSDYIP